MAKAKKDDTYIFFTGAFLLKAIDDDAWVGTIKSIKQQHKLTGKDLQDMIDNLENEYE